MNHLLDVLLLVPLYLVQLFAQIPSVRCPSEIKLDYLDRMPALSSKPTICKTSVEAGTNRGFARLRFSGTAPREWGSDLSSQRRNHRFNSVGMTCPSQQTLQMTPNIC